MSAEPSLKQLKKDLKEKQKHLFELDRLKWDEREVVALKHKTNLKNEITDIDKKIEEIKNARKRK